MRLNRAQIQVFSISFLDVLSCALGAIIILSLASVLSNFWKISLHMLGVGGILGVSIAIQILYTNTNALIIIFVKYSNFNLVRKFKVWKIHISKIEHFWTFQY